MAIVYLARDLTHDRPVALKVLRPELGAVLGNLLPLFDSGAAEITGGEDDIAPLMVLLNWTNAVRRE